MKGLSWRGATKIGNASPVSAPDFFSRFDAPLLLPRMAFEMPLSLRTRWTVPSGHSITAQGSRTPSSSK